MGLLRNPWSQLTILIVLIMAAIYLIHQNWVHIQDSFCEEKVAKLMAQFQKGVSGKITEKKTTTGTPAPKKVTPAPKLEFPRLFDIPPCDPKKNKTISRKVCAYLGGVMKEKTRQTCLRLLQYFDKLATKRKWTYFMVFGTLLGSWRHHGLIPYDYDMDIYVDYANRTDIINEMEKQTRFVPRQQVHHKLRIHDAQNIESESFADDIGRYASPSIDTFFFVRNATHVRRSDYPDLFVYKNEDVFPLHRRPFGGLSLLAPKDTLKHLHIYYDKTDMCHGYYTKVGKIQCQLLKNYFPFVHREFKDGKMKETLILGNRTIQVKTVDELQKNVPQSPYTLAPKP